MLVAKANADMTPGISAFKCSYRLYTKELTNSYIILIVVSKVITNTQQAFSRKLCRLIIYAVKKSNVLIYST